MNRLYECGALELGRRIRAKQITSRAVVEAHLARIDAVDGQLGAITRVLRDAALAAESLPRRGLDHRGGPRPRPAHRARTLAACSLARAT